MSADGPESHIIWKCPWLRVASCTPPSLEGADGIQRRGVYLARLYTPNIVVCFAQNFRSLFREAARSFDVLLRSYPDSYDVGLNLAICYLEAKDYS
jgi:hypothetical protein